MSDMEKILRYVVSPRPARVGWWVRSVVVDNEGREQYGSFRRELRTKKEAQELAARLREELDAKRYEELKKTYYDMTINEPNADTFEIVHEAVVICERNSWELESWLR